MCRHPFRTPRSFWVLLVVLVGCGGTGDGSRVREEHYELAPGIEVHRRVPPASPDGFLPGPVTLVHVDPELYELRLLTAAADGGARPVDVWCEEFGLVGAINASMYIPNERSTGLMIRDEHVNNPALNARFGGILAFDARFDSIPPLQFVGLDCGDFDLQRLKHDYRVLVQNYRLLDCNGEAMVWRDRKAYSSAAIGLDRRGWIVFAHSETPCRTTDFATWLAIDEWQITQAHFVEGGPEATLHFAAGGRTLRLIGSYQGAPPPRKYRAVPNVLGIAPRAGARSVP